MDKILYAQFIAEKVGVEELSVTVDVDKIARSNGAVTSVVNGASASEGRNGWYLYRLANVDEATYDYVAVFKTTDADVDQQHIAALRTDYVDHASLVAAIEGVLITAASIAAAVWSYATRTLTQAAASVASAVSGSVLTIHRGDTWSATLTGLPANTGYSKIWLSVKEFRRDADTSAIIQLLLTSPGDGNDGLQRLNGETATPAHGSITVNSASSLTFVLDKAVTAQLAAAMNLVYDVQYLIGGTISTATDGTCKITDDVTRAIS